MATYSERIVELRAERGLSQKAAAVDLGVSQALLSHYEKGIREFNLDFLCKIAPNHTQHDRYQYHISP